MTYTDHLNKNRVDPTCLTKDGGSDLPLPQAAFLEAHPNDCDRGIHPIEIILCCVMGQRQQNEHHSWCEMFPQPQASVQTSNTCCELYHIEHSIHPSGTPNAK